MEFAQDVFDGVVRNLLRSLSETIRGCVSHPPLRTHVTLEKEISLVFPSRAKHVSPHGLWCGALSLTPALAQPRQQSFFKTCATWCRVFTGSAGHFAVMLTCFSSLLTSSCGFG